MQTKKFKDISITRRTLTNEKNNGIFEFVKVRRLRQITMHFLGHVKNRKKNRYLSHL